MFQHLSCIASLAAGLVPARWLRVTPGQSIGAPGRARRLTGAGAALVVGGAAYAQEQPSLDELLDIAPPPAEEPASTEQPAPAGPTVEIDPEVQRLLEQGTLGDALESAVGQMGDVAGRLAREQDPGIGTQRIQEDILRKLDQVIAAAKQQQQQQSSSSSSSSQQQQQQQNNQAQSVAQQGQQQQAGQPNRSATASTGAATRGTPMNPQDDAQLSIEELREGWGNLPPRLRNELSEGYSERFSPLYRRLTEQYYQRLAEEQE